VCGGGGGGGGGGWGVWEKSESNNYIPFGDVVKKGSIVPVWNKKVFHTYSHVNEISLKSLF
jgi:hypothetical protein